MKSEYDTGDLMDFSYLPERNCYETLGDCVVPYFEEFTTSTEELGYSPFLTFMRPIHFTTYTSPYDINLRDVSSERGLFSPFYSL